MYDKIETYVFLLTQKYPPILDYDLEGNLSNNVYLVQENCASTLTNFFFRNKDVLP